MRNSSKDSLDYIWKEHPSYIRRFHENLEKNINLCQEVEYILNSEIHKKNIEVAQISSRAKTLESFCEKIIRKSYQKPFEEITDFAGVRIVFLYSDDRKAIENIIEENFSVIEKSDKTDGDDEKFGYGALHYLVKLENYHIGARYDDLKNKICEIQVRTILQDAWAIVAHHLSYKQESDVPQKLRRKLNALSGLFETADDQFQNIRNARMSYQEKLQELFENGELLKIEDETNIDDLILFLKTRFYDRFNEDNESLDGISDLLEELKRHGYKTLPEISDMIESALDAVLAEERDHPPISADTQEKTIYTPIGLVRTALSYMSESYLNERFKSANSRKRMKNYQHLIKNKI
ncbi:GTP pyrophosphokinase [Vogesella indigofera]|uniref:GTP pyrophosphokinase n=1 Tax=Vogesella indigofera TaxID=45465 RepID=UPI003F43A6CC